MSCEDEPWSHRVCECVLGQNTAVSQSSLLGGLSLPALQGQVGMARISMSLPLPGFSRKILQPKTSPPAVSSHEVACKWKRQEESYHETPLNTPDHVAWEVVPAKVQTSLLLKIEKNPLTRAGVLSNTWHPQPGTCTSVTAAVFCLYTVTFIRGLYTMFNFIS